MALRRSLFALTTLVLAAGVPGCGFGGDFDARAFRAAAAGEKLDALEEQARRAAGQRALLGLSRREARHLLGAPDRVGRKRHLWVWDIGLINETFGPGDAAAFYVRFDEQWSAVVETKVGQSF